MLFLWLYLGVYAFALLWVAVDRDARGAFECFSRISHSTARRMGIYAEYLLYSVGRLAVLLSLMTLAAGLAVGFLVENPLERAYTERGLLFLVMLLGATAIAKLPSWATQLRFAYFLRYMAKEFEGMVTALPRAQDRHSHWDVAQYGTIDGWTAWHPKQEAFASGGIWSAIVPMFFVGKGDDPSVVFPIDFNYFLAWQWPAERRPGERMPFFSETCSFVLEDVKPLSGRPGWTVIRAEMELEEIEELAA